MKTHMLKPITLALATVFSVVTLAADQKHLGLKRVENRAEEAVRSVGSTLEDAMLGVRIRAAMLESMKGDALDIRVSVVGDEVILRGEVRNRAVRDLAADVAAHTATHAKVRNHLQVSDQEPSAPFTEAIERTQQDVADSLLESRVKLKLLQETGTAGLGIDVRSTTGVVRLLGSVPDEEHRRIAIRSAEKVDGVKEVHDLLNVGSASKR